MLLRNRCVGFMAGWAFVLLLVTSSCVYDDRSDCPAGHSRVRIYFSYPALSYSGYEGIDPSEAFRVDLFVFDQDGLFVTHLAEEDILLNEFYYLESILPYGSYQFVSWFNLHDHYSTHPAAFVAGETTLDEALIALSQMTTGGVVDYHPHTLLYGCQPHVEITQPTTAPSPAGQDYQQVVLPLRQNTYRLRFIIRGLSDTGRAYTLSVRDDNGSYYFDNSFAPSRELLYTTSILNDGMEDPEASLTVLRLDRERSPQFSLTPEDEPERFLYENDLLDLILELERTYGLYVDFSLTYRFNIVIGFSENTAGELEAKVSINGWDIVDEGGEIG